MRVNHRRVGWIARHRPALLTIAVALGTMLFVVGLGFVGSYAGASVACAAGVAIGAPRLGRTEIREVRADHARIGDALVVLGEYRPITDVWIDGTYAEITSGGVTEGFASGELVLIRTDAG